MVCIFDAIFYEYFINFNSRLCFIYNVNYQEIKGSLSGMQIFNIPIGTVFLRFLFLKLIL